LSPHMMMCTAVVMDSIASKETHTIYPFVHHIVGNRCRDDQVRAVVVPDVLTDPQADAGLIVPVHGEFVHLYAGAGHAGAWSAVVTCFFIDTAHNVLNYVTTIRNLLPPGGVWLNLGPLSWHFADQLSETSIELPWEDLRQVILGSGFTLVTEEEVEGPYAANPRGLMHQAYTSIFFHAVRTKEKHTSSPEPTSDHLTT